MQIAAVNDGQPVHLIPVGGKAYESLLAHEKRLADSELVGRVTRIPHCSGSKSRIYKGKPEVYRDQVASGVGDVATAQRQDGEADTAVD